MAIAVAGRNGRVPEASLPTPVTPIALKRGSEQDTRPAHAPARSKRWLPAKAVTEPAGPKPASEARPNKAKSPPKRTKPSVSPTSAGFGSDKKRQPCTQKETNNENCRRLRLAPLRQN